MAAPDVVLLTEDRYERTVAPDAYTRNILHEEALLGAALGELGLRTERVSWSRAGYDWASPRAAVLRSPWDYFERFGAFSAWLDAAAARTRIINPPGLLRWNMDKHYLRDLAACGVPVPATHYFERGAAVTLAGALAASGWESAVLKPAVSGAARHTYRVAPGDVPALEPVFERLLREESLLLQPFLPGVVARGEASLVVIDGRFTHAVLKVARAGDFRVQDDHGGRVIPNYTPTAAERAVAEAAVAACPEAPAYARVDLVPGPDGRPHLMELEVVEPELFLRCHPPAARELARAVAARL